METKKERGSGGFPNALLVVLAALLAGGCGASGGGDGVAGSGPPGAPAPPAPIDRDPVCRGILNYYECSRLVEGRLLAGSGERITRSGDTLDIELSGGRELSLVDRHQGTADAVLFTYRGYLRDVAQHVVDVHYYEGVSHLLLDDRTGERVSVSAPPAVSPDGRRLAVASSAGVGGYSLNELQVWRAGPDGLELEWEITPEDWGGEDPRWMSAARIRFTRTWPCESEGVCSGPAVLRRGPTGWEVEPEPDLRRGAGPAPELRHNRCMPVRNRERAPGGGASAHDRCGARAGRGTSNRAGCRAAGPPGEPTDARGRIQRDRGAPA